METAPLLWYDNKKEKFELYGGNRMKKLLEVGNRYAKNSDWKDFALTKLCLCAMGILIGIKIPTNKKKTAAIISGGLFGVTYVILMAKVFTIVKNMMNE